MEQTVQGGGHDQHVAIYNRLAAQAREMGLDYRPVSRFHSPEVGAERIRMIQSSIRARQGSDKEEESEVAKKTKAKRAPRGGRNGVSTIQDLTKEYNALVPQAKKKGLKAKVHSSLFGSRAHGEKMVKDLRKSITAA